MARDPSDSSASAVLTIRKLRNSMLAANYQDYSTAKSQLVRLSRNQNDKVLQTLSKDAVESFERDSLSWLASMLANRDPKSVPPALDCVYARIKLGKNTMPRDMARLFTFPLIRLTIEGEYATDEHITALSGIPDLKSLNVWKGSVNGKFLKEASFPSIKSIQLVCCPLDDKNMINFEMPDLEMLGLEGSSVTNETLAKSKLTQLKCLYINGTKIDAKGASLISRFSKLEELRLDIGQVDADLVDVINASSLKRVRIVAGTEYGDRIKGIASKVRDTCRVVHSAE